jgi:hypothetical protein
MRPAVDGRVDNTNAFGITKTYSEQVQKLLESSRNILLPESEFFEIIAGFTNSELTTLDFWHISNQFMTLWTRNCALLLGTLGWSTHTQPFSPPVTGKLLPKSVS